MSMQFKQDATIGDVLQAAIVFVEQGMCTYFTFSSSSRGNGHISP
jgi:hypothetical protein